MEEVRPPRLLIDQNLRAGLARHVADLFPGSRHVRDFGLREGTDVIWLRLGHCSKRAVESLLRDHFDRIASFAEDPAVGLLQPP